MSIDASSPSAADLTFTNRGRSYVLGYGGDFYGVWDRSKQGAPIARFPRTDEGWQHAWLHYNTLESAAATPKRGRARSSKAGLVAIVLLLMTLLFAVAFTNPRLNIPLISKLTCSIKGGTWTDGSVIWEVPAGCYDVAPT